jgi:pyrroline-5-carboxylate reductase
LGKAPEVAEETLEAFAIVSDMGPTYFWFQWLELQKLGEEFGIKDVIIQDEMYEMLKVSVEALYNSGLDYDAVLDLIPVNPMNDVEENIKEFFNTKLKDLFNKLTHAG